MTTSPMTPISQPDPEIFELLEELWRRHLPSTRERLDLLQEAVDMAVAGTLDDEKRNEAQSVAHKLSGNLGMFGYKEAGELAGEIEHHFKTLVPSATHELNVYMQRLQAALADHI